MEYISFLHKTIFDVEIAECRKSFSKLIAATKDLAQVTKLLKVLQLNSWIKVKDNENKAKNCVSCVIYSNELEGTILNQLSSNNGSEQIYDKRVSIGNIVLTFDAILETKQPWSSRYAY